MTDYKQGDPVRVVGEFEVTCLQDGDTTVLPIGTIGTIASLMTNDYLADVLFEHGGKLWLGAALFVDWPPRQRANPGDVEPVDIVTAIGGTA